jgi:uncharacterized protein (DUF1810 family)
MFRLPALAHMDDPYDLQRFVDAQAPVFDDVCPQLRAGSKTTHWMWFIFPQIAGLGHSATARRFAIASRDEATAYLQHPVLGPRLRECTRLVTDVEGRSAREVFGDTDAMKFRSSMTLFAAVAVDEGIFADALRKYFGDEGDRATLDRI